MDVLIELITEIILDGSLELGTSRRVCLPIRIFALIVFLLIYVAITSGFIIFSMRLWQKGNFGFSILFLAFGLALAIGVIRIVVKKIKQLLVE